MSETKNTSKQTPIAPWSISGDFDDCMNVDILDAEGFPFAEVSPTDGEGVDEWGEISTARAHSIAAVPALLAALTEIRKKAYNAPHDKAPGILLDCLVLAEDALLVAAGGK